MKTKYLFYAAIALAVLSQGSNIANSAGQASLERQDRSAFSDSLRAQRTLTRNAQRESTLALERLESGCLPGVSTVSGQGQYLFEGDSFVTLNGQEKINGQALVCTELGSTAVSNDGVLSEIYNVAPADIQEYKSLFEKTYGKQYDTLN